MSDFEKWFRSLNANGKTVYFLGNEHKVSEMAWNHQQAIIDDLKAQLNNMEACYIEKKKQVEDQQKRVDGALFEMQQLSLMLSKDIDGYEDPAQICQSEGVDMGVRILEKALRGDNG